MTKARDLANIISGGFDATDIPNLDTAKITSGTLADARIPNLATSKITSGTFADARLPATALNSNVDLTTLSASNLTSGTVADARLPSTALNSNVDLTALSATNMTSGTLPDARFPATLPSVSGANLTNIPASNPLLASSYGQTGYIKLVGGLIIQWSLWGTFGGTVSNGSVTFPLAFPSDCYTLTTSILNGNSTALSSLIIDNGGPSKTGFNWYQADSSQSSRLGGYIAIGK